MEVVLLIGLAVGVDYALFYIRREREERRAGRSEGAALEAAAATSGRAVLVSGMTVLIAMAGMLFSGDQDFKSFAVGTMIVVAVAMLGSLTVLPAVLSKLGDRVEKGRIPFVHRLRRHKGESRVWGAVLDRVLRRPLVSAVAAAAVLVALAVPALGLHTTQTGTEGISIAAIEPFERLIDAFPGSPGARDRRDQGRRRQRRTRPRRDCRPEAEGARNRSDERADRRHDQPRRDRHQGRDSARGQGHRRRLERGARNPPRDAVAGDARPGRRRRVRRHRCDRRVAGLQRGAGEVATARLRLRPAVRIRAAARHVPLDRDRAQGDRPQPALRRGRLRRDRRGVPVGLGREPARLPRRTAASRTGCPCSSS